MGRAIVRRLAADGAAVVFTYATNEAAAKQVVAEVETAGGWARAVRADLSEPAQVERLFAAVDQHFARLGIVGLDILVNNAGVPTGTPIAEVTEAEYDRVMAVNAKSVFFAIQHAIRRLRDGGRIVTLSTMSTAYATPGEAVYAASKAAVEQFTRVATQELGERGITVNTVSPGPTDTDLLRGAVPEEALQGVAQMTPLGRLGRPADIASVVAFLVGLDGGWLTGQNLRADGGLV
ncbi:MAG: SDR family oxidoreductase [Streptosporangiales bacterium]|nr:SDR family oxidoreductase [Streptosporangiales bacterium]